MHCCILMKHVNVWLSSLWHKEKSKNIHRYIVKGECLGCTFRKNYNILLSTKISSDSTENLLPIHSGESGALLSSVRLVIYYIIYHTIFTTPCKNKDYPCQFSYCFIIRKLAIHFTFQENVWSIISLIVAEIWWFFFVMILMCLGQCSSRKTAKFNVHHIPLHSYYKNT